MLYSKKDSGFSLIDLMLALAIIGIASAVSVPTLQRWSRDYHVHNAAIDLHSHMQMAKFGAVKENKLWNINFNPGGLLGYEVRNSAGNLVKTVDFRVRYNGSIQFTDPTASKTYDAPTLAFNPSGLSDKGYVYLSNKDRSKYYRVGLPFITGSIRTEKWNGAAWE